MVDLRLRPLLATAIAAACSAGCHPARDARPPLAVPTAAVRVDHFAGSALSGPQPGVPNAADAWGVSATLIAVTTPAPADFSRVGPAARLVLGPDAGAVVAPSSRLVYSTLIRSPREGEDLRDTLGDARSLAPFGTADAALPEGATASVAIDLPAGTPMRPEFARRSVRVELSRRAGGGDAYDLAIISDDLVNPTSADATPMRTASEMIVLPRTLTDGADRFALAIPMAFPNSRARGVVVDVTVGGTPSDETLAKMRGHLDRSAAAVAAARGAPPSPEELALGQAVEALGAAGASPRGSLAFVAARTGARLAEAVALVADDSVLQVIAGQAQARLAQLSTRDARSIGWLLDRTTIDVLSSVSEADAPRVLPPIEGALSLFAGAAGRQLDVLRSIARESTSSADLYERIVAENLISLEESSPALRVRAYDWLRDAGRAPAGFDPLGTPRERRTALEQARAPATAPAATAPTTQP